ncbi:MAG: hypothetical protein V4437_00845 [Patescibacteria group bacterium]
MMIHKRVVQVVVLIGILVLLVLGAHFFFQVNKTSIITAEGSEGSEWVNIVFNTDHPTRNTPGCIFLKAFNAAGKDCVPKAEDFTLYGEAFRAPLPIVSGVLKNEDKLGRFRTLEVQPDPFIKGDARSKEALLDLKENDLLFLFLPQNPVTIEVVEDTWQPIQIKSISIASDAADHHVAQVGDTVSLVLVLDRPLRVDSPSIRFFVKNTDPNGSDFYLDDTLVEPMGENTYKTSFTVGKNTPKGVLHFDLYNIIDATNQGLNVEITSTTDGSSIEIK